MKIVRKDPAAPFLPTLAAEATIIRSCCHPSIIQLIDVYESDSRVYLLYPLIPDGTLLQCAARSPQPTERTIAAIIAQLADALGYLHSRSVVHRDLKPDNILVHSPILSPDCVVKIADLGHAYFLRHATRLPEGEQLQYPQPGAVAQLSEEAAGTMGYIAPELFLGEGAIVTPAADIWSLGAVMYFLLTGKELPPVLPDQELLIDGLDDVSPWAVDLLKRCLDMDPSARITPAGILSHPWVTGVGSDSQCGKKISVLPEGATAILNQRMRQREQDAQEELVSIVAMGSASAVL